MFVEGIEIGESMVSLSAEECALLAEVCHKSDVGVMDGRDQDVVFLGTTFSLLAALGHGTMLMRMEDFDQFQDRLLAIPFNGKHQGSGYGPRVGDLMDGSQTG